MATTEKMYRLAALMTGAHHASLAELLDTRPDWMRDAACIEHPELSWFPGHGEKATAALAICGACLVVGECRQYAMADPTLRGIWGGTTTRERVVLRHSPSRAVAS